MDGVRAMLAALELRHIFAMRSIVRMLPRLDPELAAWMDHALTWEECRRGGIDGALVAPGVMLGSGGARRAAKVLRAFRGPLVQSVQIRLFLAAVRTELETYPQAVR